MKHILEKQEQEDRAKKEKQRAYAMKYQQDLDEQLRQLRQRSADALTSEWSTRCYVEERELTCVMCRDDERAGDQVQREADQEVVCLHAVSWRRKSGIRFRCLRVGVAVSRKIHSHGSSCNPCTTIQHTHIIIITLLSPCGTSPAISAGRAVSVCG